MGDQVVLLGAGVVGYATGRALSEVGHDVRFVDANPERCAFVSGEGFDCQTSLELGDESTIILVAVQTPSAGEGYNLTPFTLAVASIGKAMKQSSARHLVVTRSTVPPGTADNLVTPTLEQACGLEAGKGFAVGSAPEFLREATALADASNPWMTVVGSRDPESKERLAELFSMMDGEHRSYDEPVTPELIKVVHNYFNAAKITFFNEIFALSTKLGIDGDEVANVVVRSAEGSINPDYGTKGGRPFGGHCLPKDLDGILGLAEQIGMELPLAATIRYINDELERTVGVPANSSSTFQFRGQGQKVTF